MSATNRAAVFAKLQRVAKKHYPVVKPPAGRNVLEHLMYACCLQNSQFEQADEALARIQRTYFDWNEVRVATIAELGEVMNCLNQPTQAANRLKKTLNSVFETHYAFDIDFLKKENLGKAVEILDKGRGITPFVLAYVAQSGLGGHQIGIDEAMLNLMFVVGAIDEQAQDDFKISGLERAIPKTKGIEFFSTVHQLAVALHANPFKPDIRKIVLTIEPSAKERFAKRASPASKKRANDNAETDRIQSQPAVQDENKSKAKPAARKKTSGNLDEPPVKRKAGRPRKSSETESGKSPTKQLKKKKPR